MSGTEDDGVEHCPDRPSGIHEWSIEPNVRAVCIHCDKEIKADA